MGSILTTKPTKMQKMMMVFGTVLVMAMCMALVMFADSETTSTIETGVRTGMKNIYDILKALVIPVGAVSLTWNVFKIFTGGQKEMDAAKKNILVTCCVVAGVYLAPSVITQVASWFSSIGTGTVFTG